MELSGFTPRERSGGDQFPAKEAVDRLLVAQVREHRTGIVTKFKPEGGEGVVVDVADVTADAVWIDVLWMNGAVVDNLAPYLGQTVPIKLVWTPSQKGGNAYIGVEALEGAELAQAGQWAQNNPTRFDQERLERQSNNPAATQQPAAPAATAPAAAPAAQPQQATADPNDPAVQALLQQINGGQAPPTA